MKELLRKSIAAVAASASFVLVSGFGSDAMAAGVEGFGSIRTNLSDPSLVQIDTAYQHSTSLAAFKKLELRPVELDAAGQKLLQYSGEAQFGRLGVATVIAGATAASTLSTGVDAFMGFSDLISPSHLNPAGASFLRLDVGLSGTMRRSDNDFGNNTAAHFTVNLIDPLDPSFFSQLSVISFLWSDVLHITNKHGGGVNGFVPLAGEEPRFTLLTPGGPLPNSPGFDYFFGARGFIDVPLDGNVPSYYGSPFLTRGAPFLLDFSAAASSSCADEVPACFASTDFGSTALIGNARIVDQNGNLVAGAGFTSQSGYDYLTPPGSLLAPVPEPEVWAMMLAGLGVLGAVRRRRKTLT